MIANLLSRRREIAVRWQHLAAQDECGAGRVGREQALPRGLEPKADKLLAGDDPDICLSHKSLIGTSGLTSAQAPLCLSICGASAVPTTSEAASLPGDASCQTVSTSIKDLPLSTSVSAWATGRPTPSQALAAKSFFKPRGANVALPFASHFEAVQAEPTTTASFADVFPKDTCLAGSHPRPSPVFRTN